MQIFNCAGVDIKLVLFIERFIWHLKSQMTLKYNEDIVAVTFKTLISNSVKVH